MGCDACLGQSEAVSGSCLTRRRRRARCTNAVAKKPCTEIAPKKTEACAGVVTKSLILLVAGAGFEPTTFRL